MAWSRRLGEVPAVTVHAQCAVKAVGRVLSHRQVPVRPVWTHSWRFRLFGTIEAGWTGAADTRRCVRGRGADIHTYTRIRTVFSICCKPMERPPSPPPIHCLSEHSSTSFPGCSFIPLISILFITTTNLHHSFTIYPSQLVFATFIAPFLTNFSRLCIIILLTEAEYIFRSRRHLLFHLSRFDKVYHSM